MGKRYRICWGKIFLGILKTNGTPSSCVEFPIYGLLPTKYLIIYNIDLKISLWLHFGNNTYVSSSRSPSRLRRKTEPARLLWSRDRIPLRQRMFVRCVSCAMQVAVSARGDHPHITVLTGVSPNFAFLLYRHKKMRLYRPEFVCCATGNEIVISTIENYGHIAPRSLQIFKANFFPTRPWLDIQLLAPLRPYKLSTTFQLRKSQGT
jgi:hypothetical protein